MEKKIIKITKHEISKWFSGVYLDKVYVTFNNMAIDIPTKNIYASTKHLNDCMKLWGADDIEIIPMRANDKLFNTSELKYRVLWNEKYHVTIEIE